MNKKKKKRKEKRNNLLSAVKVEQLGQFLSLLVAASVFTLTYAIFVVTYVGS